MAHPSCITIMIIIMVQLDSLECSVESVRFGSQKQPICYHKVQSSGCSADLRDWTTWRRQGGELVREQVVQVV